jgi:hypothetical protein
MTAWLLHQKAEYALARYMLGMATVYVSIHVDPKEGATSSDRSIHTAVGLVCMFCMLGYCRRIIFCNHKGKGTSVKTALVGVIIAIGAMAIPSVRYLWVKFTEFEPAFVTPLMIPLGFLLCGLAMYVERAFEKHKEAQEARAAFQLEAHHKH